MDHESPVAQPVSAATRRRVRHRREDELRTAGCQRDVERVCLGVIGHGPQVLQPARPRTVVHPLVEPRDPLRAENPLSADRVDIDDVLIAQVVGVAKRPGLRVKLPQDADLAHLEQRSLVAPVDEDDLEDLVEVMSFGGNVLEVPADRPGLWVDGQGRVGIQRGARRAPLRARPRLGLGSRPVDQVGAGVVAPGEPGVGASAVDQRQVSPRVTTGVPRPATVAVRHSSVPLSASCAEIKQTSFL